MESQENRRVCVSAVGDIGLTGAVAEGLSINGAGHPFAFVKSFLENSDIVFGNLEIPFVHPSMRVSSKEIPEAMRATPDGALALKEASFNLVSLANNHVMDFGTQGLETTMAALEAAGIFYIGAGHNLEEARKPAIFKRDGCKMGFLAYAQKGKHSAAKNSPGATPIERRLIEEDILELSAIVDWIFVSLHFGTIYSSYPKPEDRVLAHWVIDKGAHVVLGHHPHTLQEIERYRGGIVAYSLGEFIFDPRVGNVCAEFASEIRRRSIILNITCKDGHFDCDRTPVLAGEDYRPKICSNADKEIMLAELDEISAGPLSQNNNYYIDVGKKTVPHNIKVLIFHVKNLNWRYVVQKLTRIRIRHLKLIFFYFKGRFKPL